VPDTTPTPPFSRLAEVYDLVMREVEYHEWLEFALEVLATQAWPGVLYPGRMQVLDLACGTGNSTVPLLDYGFQVIGLDASAQMLAVARHKLPAITFIEANFLTFKLQQRFDLVMCVFDSLNNLTEPQDLATTFANIAKHLNPAGWLVFDINTKLGVRELWDENTWAGELEGAVGRVSYHWTHRYDPITELGWVTARCMTESDEFTEQHGERGYDPHELLPMLAKAGFVEVLFFEYPDFAHPTPETPRVWCFAQTLTPSLERTG
jgi:ubiquinone/menaquinone biosynthesis C-methylase UbiE